VIAVARPMGPHATAITETPNASAVSFFNDRERFARPRSGVLKTAHTPKEIGLVQKFFETASRERTHETVSDKDPSSAGLPTATKRPTVPAAFLQRRVCLRSRVRL
jgi:hypothetical protein